MFESLPFAPRKVEATEARLNRIYEAAKLGLKGDALALASGMGAITATLWTLLAPGDEVIVDKTLYGCTFAFMQHGLAKFGITGVFKGKFVIDKNFDWSKAAAAIF